MLEKSGIPVRTLSRLVERGMWQRVIDGVFLEGVEKPTSIERAVAVVLKNDGVASGGLAAVLHGVDGAKLSEPYFTVPRSVRKKNWRARYSDLASHEITEIDGVRCTTALSTLLDLAPIVTDDEWEHALEWILRKRHATIRQIEERVELLGASRTSGVGRMRRVLKLRPVNAPHTDSLLETLMVQLIRRTPTLPEPTRQVEVLNRHGDFAGRVDLAWPELGVFIELDGQHHKDQPVYDSRRETAIVAATGWLPGRFTWHEVTLIWVPTARRLVDIHEQARLRKHFGPLLP